MTAGRANQRLRILDAITQVVGESGYLGARMGEIARRAGVSRATFYEMFESKQRAFLAAHQGQAGETVARVAKAANSVRASRVEAAVLSEIAAFAYEQPGVFAFLTHEATLAGPDALAARDQFLTELSAVVERAREGEQDVHRAGPDIPARVLVGAAIRGVGINLRRGEEDPGEFTEQLLAWANLYRAPGGDRRWQTLEPDRALLELRDGAPAYAPLTPPESRRGRHQLAPSVVRRIQRERILHATATTVSEKGYEHTSVADIVGAAGVSRDVFYTHLRNRDDALDQAGRFFFEQSVATTAGAFFTSSDSWPEQLWAAGLGLSELLAAAPEFTKLAFIDASAPDTAAARRTDELFLGFTMFVERGLREGHNDVPDIAPAAVVVGLVEAVLHFIVERRTQELPGLLGLAAYVALAPFIGVREANRFVDLKLAELRS